MDKAGLIRIEPALAKKNTRVVVITGASSGIGKATALRLAADGVTLVLAARRADELELVKAEIERRGGRAITVVTDVSRLDNIDRLIERALSVNGGIDALINVAGIGSNHSIMSDDDQIQAAVAVNLVAPIRLMRGVIPAMRKAGRGSIVNIGSIAGEIGIQGVYSATKFGLRGMTDSVRRELLDSGISVTLIEPGYVATPLTRGNGRRMPGPEIVARAVERALRRPRRRIIVPGKYRVAVFLASTFPGITDRLFADAVTKQKGAS